MAILPDEIPPPRGVENLIDLLRDMRVAVLTGAGCSTESGIPDYRGPITRERERKPMTYQEFVGSDAARRRYWSRSVIGWPWISKTEPNDTHRHLATLEEAELISGLITQNVDGLHSQAGSRRVVELHGTLAEVVCLDCGARHEREAIQQEMVNANEGWLGEHGVAEYAPDGDAVLTAQASRDFVAPSCDCGGMLKPNVVFFGENVPKTVVESAWQIYEDADLLWVVGSSLTVYSGFRFVRRAARERKPVAITNLCETRGDPHAWTICRGLTSEVLATVVDELS